ncbi:nucleoside phosphorylase domain-containing protein [Trichoderma barbatum]
MSHVQPSRRDEFDIAIICALALEYDAVSLLFDQFWDEDGDSYGRAAGDVNNYTTGRIGKFNVVLALLPHIGKANAASAVAGLRSSYSCLRLVLLVGICGGVPQLGHSEILLGDVVISKTIVQYDFRKQYPDEVVRKNTFEDNLSKPVKDIRNLLVTLETELGLERLHKRTAYFLAQLQKNRQRYNYPGTAEDRLFISTYCHKHRASHTCDCSENDQSDLICHEARDLYCHDLQCDDRYLVARERLEQKRQLEIANDARAQEPAIHFGAIASGDTEMKSAAHRDKISREERVIAFETEGAGAWEEMPCIIVKGVCDYADCHKSEKWLRFAAATSASAASALLERYCKTDKPSAAILSEFGVTITGTLRESESEILVARLQAENSSLQENIAYLRQQASKLMHFMGLIPRQISYDGCVTVIDALNRPIRFYLETIRTKLLFIEVLKGMFDNLGLSKIEREEWLLEDRDTRKLLDLKESWGSLIRPGQTLYMSMIFRRRKTSSTECPSCHLENLGDPQEQITWFNISPHR